MHVERCDHGSAHLLFGEGTTVGDLAQALSGLPQDAVLGELEVLYFNPGDDDCEGQPIPDCAHDVFLAALHAYPVTLPEHPEIPESPAELLA